MKKIIIPIIVLVVILVGLILGGYLLMDRLFPKADPINVPTSDAVISMTVSKTEMRKAGDPREVASTDIEGILTKLSEAEPTRKMTLQDTPEA